jgi:hypothetical protein
MTETNCPNCGATIDIYADKCAYCDTPYTYLNRRSSTLYADDKPIYSCSDSVSKEYAELKLQKDQEWINASLIDAMVNFGISAVQAANSRLTNK